MIKLYQKGPDGIIRNYHEAWVSKEKRELIEHFGELGDSGQAKVHKYNKKCDDRENIENLLSAARECGFNEVDENSFDWLVIEFPVKSDSFAASDELDVRHKIEDMMNETLGWTGLGHCDGGSSGMGTMDIACPVVQYQTAEPVVRQSLEKAGYSNFRIYCEDR